MGQNTLAQTLIRDRMLLTRVMLLFLRLKAAFFRSCRSCHKPSFVHTGRSQPDYFRYRDITGLRVRTLLPCCSFQTPERFHPAARWFCSSCKLTYRIEACRPLPSGSREKGGCEELHLSYDSARFHSQGKSFVRPTPHTRWKCFATGRRVMRQEEGCSIQCIDRLLPLLDNTGATSSQLRDSPSRSMTMPSLLRSWKERLWSPETFDAVEKLCFQEVVKIRRSAPCEDAPHATFELLVSLSHPQF